MPSLLKAVVGSNTGRGDCLTVRVRAGDRDLAFRHPTLRFETFGGDRCVSNAAREEVRGLRARFVGRARPGNSLRVHFERRAGCIVPALGQQFRRISIRW